MLSSRIAKTALAIAGAFLFAGCVPVPHHETVSPAIDGAVHRNGQPVAGARLYVEDGKACTFQGEPLAKSDDKGAFRIPERQRMDYIFVFAMDPAPRAGWRLCIADGDRHYEAWYEEIPFHYRRFSLECNLESAPQVWGWRGWYGGLYKVAGVCRSRADEESGKLTPLPAAPAAR